MMSKIFKTVDEEMTFLTEYAGATEDFIHRFFVQFSY